MIKQLLKRIRGNKSSEDFVNELKMSGAKVGEGTCFYVPNSCFIDKGKGKYIEIGEKCKISRGVTILAHDYSYTVLNDVYGVLPQNTMMTVIGDNVFIGMNAIILIGSHVGNNVIIGAGSVVNGDVEDNSVYAGNPAKEICTLEEYYQKHMQRFERSAVMQAKRIKEVTGRKPTENEMEFYGQLFNNDTDFYEQMKTRLGDAPQKLPVKTKYKSLDEFLKTYDI